MPEEFLEATSASKGLFSAELFSTVGSEVDVASVWFCSASQASADGSASVRVTARTSTASSFMDSSGANKKKSVGMDRCQLMVDARVEVFSPLL